MMHARGKLQREEAGKEEEEEILTENKTGEESK